ncbi:MAG: hypothetical protein AB1896_19365, partial [Thermodesulfobacteriota bacterium]
QLGTSLLLDRQAELEKNLGAMSLLAAELEADRDQARESGRNLAQTLAELAREHERQVNEAKVRHESLAAEAEAGRRESARLSRQLEALEAEHRDTLGLIRRQAAEVQTQRDRLAEVYPLLSFFLERVGLWAVPRSPESPAGREAPEGAKFLLALVHLLKQENEVLKEKVGVLAEDRRALVLTNDHLLRGRQVITARLEELEPVLVFFQQAWLSATLGLAQAQADRAETAETLKRLREEHQSLASEAERLAGRLGRTEKELAAAWASLAGAQDDRDQARRLAAEYKGLLGRAEEKVRALEAARVDLAGLVANQGRGLANLETEGLRLLAANKRLEDREAAYQEEGRAAEREILSWRRRAAEASGRADSARAALQRLSGLTRKAMGRLEYEVQAQAHTVQALERRLDERAAKIRELEQAQDRLALLLWTMTRTAGADGQVLDSLARLSGERGFRDAAQIAGARLHELAATAATRLAAADFRRAAGRAVRRGLLSLLLAGGVVFSLPQESSKATALVEDQPPPRAVARLLEQEPLEPGPAVSVVYNTYLDRPFDLGFLTTWEKAKGFDYIQKRITQEVDAVAEGLGLQPEEYLEMVRTIYEPGRTVSLEDLKDNRNSVLVLRRHFPDLFADFRGGGLGRDEFLEIYRLALAGGPEECRFWNRLYAEYRQLGADPERGLAMILNNIRVHTREKEEVSRIEFVGQLSPIFELEEMNLAEFSRVITPYFKANIKMFTAHAAFAYAHKPEEISDYARRLAEDMYVAAKAFGVPRTLFISIAHQESYFANVLGDNSMSASPFQIYQPTKPYIIKSMSQKGLMVPGVPARLQENVSLAAYMAANHISDLIRRHSRPWGQDKSLLCDLDQVAEGYNGGSHYPPAVLRKKLRLMRYLDRVRQMAVQTRARPRA